MWRQNDTSAAIEHLSHCR